MDITLSKIILSFINLIIKKNNNPKSAESIKLPSESDSSRIDDVKLIKQPQQKVEHLSTSVTIEEALNKALLLKRNVISSITTLNDYKSRLKKFKVWVLENYKDLIHIKDISKKIIIEFLNYIQLETSARNRNNYRTVLSAIFQVLEDNEIIEKNFITKINIIKTKPVRHKTYSQEEQESIFEYLESHDKLLLLYIKFISYNFLRPIEVCRLRVKDINTEKSSLQFEAKNKTLKTKLIPDILSKELPDLSKLNGDHLFFTPSGIGGEWETKLNNRRDYFSKRFKSVVKDHFGYGKNYGLYSFRHTFITKLYRALKKDSTPFEAKSKLMFITGHDSMEALEKYLRNIDAELPSDYSEHL